MDELELENRSFQFSDNITKLLILRKHYELYLLNSNYVIPPQLKNYSSNLLVINIF